MLTRFKSMPLIVVGVMAIAGAMTSGYRTSPSATRTTSGNPIVDTTELERLRKQAAGLAVQKESLQATLADTQRRLDGCRHTICRYREELAYVDEQLETLKGGEK